MTPWVIQPLDRRHDRASFDCGNEILSTWLKSRSNQFEKRDLSRTYVAVRPGETTVAGYYAISAHRVVHDHLPDDLSKGLPRLDVPVVLIGRLAVDLSVQGQGLGRVLLIDALKRIRKLGDQLGIRAAEVDAIDDTAKNFYLKFGFRSLLDDPGHLYLPMQTIRSLPFDAED